MWILLWNLERNTTLSCRFLFSELKCWWNINETHFSFFFLFLLFNVFVMRSRLSHLKLYQHIQRRDKTMSFLCSRCFRDFFKICKILLDVDTCDECIKSKRSCDVFIFETTCEFRSSLFMCDFYVFQKNVLKMKRSSFMSKLKILSSSILSRIKKFNSCILVKRKFVMICSLASSIFVVCWSSNVVLFNVSRFLKRKKTILSCRSNVCFLVLTRSMILLFFILSRCMSQSLKRLSLS